ncbi:hypothetical protein UlMin_002964 [Ulmus minor]
MGKRKRASSDQNQIQPPVSSALSPDVVPCSSRMELLSEEKPLHAIDSSELKPLSSVLDIADSSMKQHHAHNPSGATHHQGLGRSVFLKRSRHNYAHQYSRRGSANPANASTSHGKISPFGDDKLSFKLATQCSSEFGKYSEYREKAFSRPDRIRSSSLVMDAISTDVKMVCGICQKALRRKHYFLESTMSAAELSVVAVLVCGHIYHSDCLELKTSFEDRRDPPCPSCTGLLSRNNGNGE